MDEGVGGRDRRPVGRADERVADHRLDAGGQPARRRGPGQSAHAVTARDEPRGDPHAHVAGAARDEDVFHRLIYGGAPAVDAILTCSLSR